MSGALSYTTLRCSVCEFLALIYLDVRWDGRDDTDSVPRFIATQGWSTNPIRCPACTAAARS